jgi:hypothetical protein
MQQVQYGFDLTQELLLLQVTNPKKNTASAAPDTSTSEQEVMMKNSLKAQLSHSNGIRGFMVSYLTADESPADDENMPDVLRQALRDQADTTPDLIPLACT